MSRRLYDNHGREINYLRLAVTDRCNLRCFYCMPEEGLDYGPRSTLLSYEEMVQIVRVLAPLGVHKLRLTGGEPFLRRDFMDFLYEANKVEGLEQIHLTTNGTLTAPHIPKFKSLGIRSVNLSLDTLDSKRFYEITRRDSFDKVWETFELLLEHDIQTKINAVVMEGHNIDDILPLVELTEKYPVSVRFIEEMHFNGGDAHYKTLKWDHRKILEHIRTAYPLLEKMADEKSSTSYNYRIPGHQGTIGVIAAHSRTFCGSCNRIRITPTGLLKTCLYDDGAFNVRDLMRAGATDAQMQDAFISALHYKAKDGWEAEKNRSLNNPTGESMATIGG